MSNSLAIAAVTATLRNLIKAGIGDEVSGATVTTQPPDEVKTPGNNLINIFLYQTTIDVAWRNRDMPRQIKPGETGLPPLALNLFYLLTAYGKNDDAPELPDLTSHRLLGRAMRVLHDHPVLSGPEIKSALSGNDLNEQIEHVRITQQPISLDDMSKLWTTFQSKYRISTAYQVAVVLIESQRPSLTPLPVLTRGEKDRGVDAQGNLLAPFPTLTELVLPTKTQSTAQPGDTIALRGHHLDGDSMIARFTSSRLPDPVLSRPLPPVTTTDFSDVKIKLPDDAADPRKWVPGYYTVALLITRTVDGKTETRSTNELSFALAPKITIVNPVSHRVSDGDFTLTVSAIPAVALEQRASLLFAGGEVFPAARAAKTDPFEFLITPTAAMIGANPIRLRVDGVDSMVVDHTKEPPEFLTDQKVNITA
jgi:hypothetical protein